MEDVISAQAFTNCASMHNLFSLKKYLTKKNVIRNIEIIKGLMRKTHTFCTTTLSPPMTKRRCIANKTIRAHHTHFVRKILGNKFIPCMRQKKYKTYLDPGFWEPDFLCQPLPSKHVGIMRPFKFWKRETKIYTFESSHSVNNVESSVKPTLPISGKISQKMFV